LNELVAVLVTRRGDGSGLSAFCVLAFSASVQRRSRAGARRPASRAAELRWRAAGAVFIVFQQPWFRVCAPRAPATGCWTAAACLGRCLGALEADFLVCGGRPA